MRFADRAATLAQQEHDAVAGLVMMQAGDERVAAGDAVHEAMLEQKVERAVDRNRRRARPDLGKPVHDLVGAERAVAGRQRVEHLAADRRQAQAALARIAPRRRQGRGLAARMVVRGMLKQRSDIRSP